MDQPRDRAIAIVGMGALLPDAPDVAAFWHNICDKRYSIGAVPEDRWHVDRYFNSDRKAPAKTYSKIGGFIRDFEFDWKRFRIPPKVATQVDDGQKWALTVAADTLADYGYPQRPLDLDRVGVVVGAAMGGDRHLETHARISFPDFAAALEQTEPFQSLGTEAQRDLLAAYEAKVAATMPVITEDSMPGELPNIMAGRIANVLNLRGPSFTTDAACASSLAAISSAINLLEEHQCDAVVTGGVDRNMAASTFVKFAKIGALSASGSRPFADGADGFVMGEGCALFLLKRLRDADAAGDRIYAVIRGIGLSSDGKGKGITAPNPVGQALAVARAWENAGLDPASATLIEAHGTSTPVGDAVEAQTLAQAYAGAPAGSIALGSAKGNIGHLKAAAGAAAILKTALALHHRQLPPTINADVPNPAIDFSHAPFFLNHQLRPWPQPMSGPRRAGVSAYGFGGTNFHVVLEEAGVPIEGRTGPGRYTPSRVDAPAPAAAVHADSSPAAPKAPLRGILALGATTVGELRAQIKATRERVAGGWTPELATPNTDTVGAPERLVIDFDADAHANGELLARLDKAIKVLAKDERKTWDAMAAQGIFRGSGERPGKIAFLYPGQGSQYLNMGRELATREAGVRKVLDEGDAVMEPILGKKLSDFVFVSEQAPEANLALMDTAVTQPAMLTIDTALHALLAEYGFAPDMVMGHSLGEYAALIAAGVMPFAHALETSAARGREMAKVKVEDCGLMAAVFAPYAEVEQTLGGIDGYVVAANVNSNRQCVIGGATAAVQEAVTKFESAGHRAVVIPVSHAFHTKIVAPASKPLREVLDRLDICTPKIPLVHNVTGEFCSTDPNAIKDILQEQVAAPVQWVKGMQTLYAAGVRTFVEVGPKKVLEGFVDDVFADDPDVVSICVVNKKLGEVQSFNHALCALYAAGVRPTAAAQAQPAALAPQTQAPQYAPEKPMPAATPTTLPATTDLGQLLLAALQQAAGTPARAPDRNDIPRGSIVVSGTGLGLPGTHKRVMDPDNVLRLMRGEQFLSAVPEGLRDEILSKRMTRLVKETDGSGHFEMVTEPDDVIKLAGSAGAFDLAEEYGVPAKLVEALDITSQLAMAAGLDALREAGIPLVRTYKKTTTGKHLPERWRLPEALRDETGVLFASAFPAHDRLIGEMKRYYTWQSRHNQLHVLDDLRQHTTDPNTLGEIARKCGELREALEAEPYAFDRRFLFRILSMGHSQFAEYIGARGPNNTVNAACASTTSAVAQAEDWIRSGRCRRVVIIAADNPTGDTTMDWMGAAFQVTGAAALDARIEDAALPFDRRRHGMLLGMGAAALVVESEDAVRERGMRGIAEVLATTAVNSAHHATRLELEHIGSVMDRVLTAAERRFGVNRLAMAPELVFLSHETHTPARGGSAAAEIHALRHTFGAAANQIVITNTKGYTGHPMAAGIEDVMAVKILELGIVPAVPNLKEPDPDLGPLNLSRGGRYPATYTLRLAAGFGSQIAMTLCRRIPGAADRIDNRLRYEGFLAAASGYDRVETEVVQRVLRIKEQGVPARVPMASSWQHGTGPVVRAAAPGTPVAQPVSRPRFAIQPTVAATHPVFTPAPEPVAVEIPAPAPMPVVATPVAPTPVAAAPVTANASVTTRVLQIVAAKTGYPEDMLELDLDLEADLGIDTVKQAETVAEIRAAFDIPREDNISLRDFATLERVVQFVHERRPDLSATEPTAVAAPVVPVPVPEASAAPTPTGSDDIAAKVLQIVAAKTGYPEDMLELDLDLEADLGIDTVKQAETIAEIRTAFEIPKTDNISLRDFPTLGAVVQFVRDQRGDLAGGAAAAATAAAAVTANAPVTTTATAGTTYDLAGADAFPRRVATATPRPHLDLCKPTGVILNANSRVLLVQDQGGVGKALHTRLDKLNVTVLTVAAPMTQDALAARLETWLSDGPIHGVYWLPALDVAPDLEAADLASWREANRVRVKCLYTTMKCLYETVGAPGTFLISGTRLGGLHGYERDGALDPLGGAVTGFTKAYKRERPECLVKAVDFPMSRKTATIADALIAETLADPGIVEVGHRDGLRFSVTLQERPAQDGKPGMKLSSDTVFVVSGAAGGITSAITADLAGASGGIFYLLDLTATPDRSDTQIALWRNNRDQLKNTLIDRMRAAGERPTPKAIDGQLAAIERRESALRAIEAVEAAGGTAHYYSVDMTDAEAVAGAMADVREHHGHIDVLLHAAGLEISRTLPDKPRDQFDLVFDVKVDGYFNLLKSADGMRIGATVVFSSVAGRFGNSGQTDYSAANDLLCKLSSYMRRARPDTRAIAIDWSAWGGIGMATRGSIPAIMKAAGIDMLPPEVGVPTIRRELTAGGTRDELVVGSTLGVLVAELDPDGGLDRDKAAAWLAAREQPWGMVGNIEGAGLYSGLRVTTELDPTVQPFLYDHQVEAGLAYLPGVMGMESFAELARLVAPDYHVAAVEEVSFNRPFKFYRDQPRQLVLTASPTRDDNGDLVVRTTLESVTRAKPDLPPVTGLHFTGTVRLSTTPPAAPPVEVAVATPNGARVGEEEIYKIFFHGPAYRVIEQAALQADSARGDMKQTLPDNAAPNGAVNMLAPRAVELCFQTAGLWEIYKKKTLALPASVESVTVCRDPSAAGGKPLHATVVAVDDERSGISYDARVLDADGTVYVAVKGYRTTPLSKVQPAWRIDSPTRDAPAPVAEVAQ